MIFYKAIKYKIIDYALDIFLKTITRNITSISGTIPLEDLAVGMSLSKISAPFGLEYSRCHIRKIDTVEEANGQLCYIISFTYLKYKNTEPILVEWTAADGYETMYDYPDERLFSFFI